MVVDREAEGGVGHTPEAEVREILDVVDVECENESVRVGPFAPERESCSFVDIVDTGGLHHEWWLESDQHIDPIRYERSGRGAVVRAPRDARFRVDIRHHTPRPVLHDTTTDMSEVREIRCVPLVR